MSGLASAEKQDLKKSFSGAGLALIKDKPPLVIGSRFATFFFLKAFSGVPDVLRSL
jgi:hypothetical protein